MGSPAVLLHLTTLPDWFCALRTGRVEPPSLSSQGFVHLSPPESVDVPANALFESHNDVWLLVIDPATLRAPVRWEAADPPGEVPRMFPHLYGPVDLGSVIAVVPYPREPLGRFEPPAAPPRRADLAARATAMEWYLARARAARRGELSAGVSVRHPEYSTSYEHNRLILHRPLPLAETEQLCAEELAGLAHWQVCVDGDMDASSIEAFAAGGWSHVENLLMVAVPPLASPSAAVPVERVAADEVRQARAAMWRRDLPDASDDDVRQLVERELLDEQVTDLHHLVVRDDGSIAAQADLYVLGATAQIDWVETEPAYRGRGYATAIVLAAVERAHRLGADVVFLRADADDWPWRLYERLGFSVATSAQVFDREVGAVESSR